MHIFNTAQIHAWDEFTIRKEPVASIDLMERAAGACFNWLVSNNYRERRFAIFCGKGNNGGDGLAIARMLAGAGQNVSVHILEFGHKGTVDFQQNLARLHETTATITFIPNEATIPEIEPGVVLIDAIFGSGLNRHLEGLTASLVDHINSSGNEIIAIDIPTGLFADKHTGGSSIIRANHTLTFQSLKLAFLFRESQVYIGELHVLDIGLHPDFSAETECAFQLVDRAMIRKMLKKREKFSHKGDYGHGALVAGSKGLMGAAVLCAKAFIRAGAGKLTCHIPETGYTIMQVSVPEAMSKVEKGQDHIAGLSDLDKYDALGIGPGLGLYDSHVKLLGKLFDTYTKPVVIDADGLNVLSRDRETQRKVPHGSIITPHTREFERLFGEFNNEDERMQEAIKQAAALNIVVVLKGPYTLIATPNGKAYFNSTGNPGMATGGSGDVLTGIITSLLCQGYEPVEAAILGVYVHGVAGDIAASRLSMEALIASDIVDYLGEAFADMRRET